jgi:cytochrome P450
MRSEPLPSTEQAFRSAHSPRAAYYDSADHIWIISRFSDLQAAFLEPDLCPVGAHSKDQVTAKDREEQARLRDATTAALTPAKLALWEEEFALQARGLASALPLSRPVDIVEEFGRKLALAVAVRVTGAEQQDAERLARLAAQVSARAADPDDPSLEAPAKSAGLELDDALKHSALPMAGPAFVGLSQTLPCLLANCWHALLLHRQELDQLHDNPELISRAVEELLRFAGMVNVLHRQALGDVELDGVCIKAGERLRLLIGAAHRDREQFSSPDEMDIARRGTRHFAFGAGPHACAAAPLLRMAVGIATRSFVEHFTALEPPPPVTWRGGTGFRWPTPLYAARRKN